MAGLAHLDDVHPELAVVVGHARQPRGIDRRAGHVAELLAVDIGDVGEHLAAVGHATDRAGLLGGRAVEAGRAQEIGIRVADVEPVERLSAVEPSEHRAALQRVADHAPRRSGIGDLLGSRALGLGLAALAEHARTARLRRSRLSHGSTLSESGT